MSRKNVISIDMGSSTTKMVVGRHKGSSIQILNMISIPTPSESINDGKIQDLNKLKYIIKKTMNSMKIKVKKVVFTLDSTAVITREINLPYSKDEELKRILSFELEQYFPIDLQEYIIQAKRLEDYEDDGVKKTRLLVAALPSAIVTTYFDLAKALGLEPLALDVHSNGIAKLFEINSNINKGLRDFKDTIAVIDLGYENMNVCIVENGILRFNRLLAFGGKEIDVNLSNKFNLILEQAEKIKLEHKTIDDEDAPDSYFETQEIIRGSINSWLDEIQRIFKYYTSRSPENRINKIYLYGGHSGLENIHKYFELYFDIPVEKIEDIGCINIKNKKIKDSSISTFLNAIGVIIRK